MIKQLRVDEVAQHDDIITKISVRGQEVLVPVGYLATDVLEQMDLPLNVSFELFEEEGRLEINAVTVGTKG